jgi:hypothetical protein
MFFEKHFAQSALGGKNFPPQSLQTVPSIFALFQEINKLCRLGCSRKAFPSEFLEPHISPRLKIFNGKWETDQGNF